MSIATIWRPPFIVVPLAALLHATTLINEVFFATAASVLLILAAFTRYSAVVWSDYKQMVEESARIVPTSARAQSQYATNLHNERRYEESVNVINKAIENIPNNAYLLITRSIILCNIGELGASDFAKSARVLSAETYDTRLIDSYKMLISIIADRRCPDVSTAELSGMFSNMLFVPTNRDPHFERYSQINYLIGFVEVRAGLPSKAAAAFEKSLQAQPGASRAMQVAALFATNNYHDKALYFSDIAMTQLTSIARPSLQVDLLSESDIAVFRATVRADREAARSDTTDLPNNNSDIDR